MALREGLFDITKSGDNMIMSKCILIEHFEHKKFVHNDKLLCRNFSFRRSFLHPKNLNFKVFLIFKFIAIDNSVNWIIVFRIVLLWITDLIKLSFRSVIQIEN